MMDFLFACLSSVLLSLAIRLFGLQITNIFVIDCFCFTAIYYTTKWIDAKFKKNKG